MANGRDRFQFDEAALGQMENIRRIGLRRLRNKNEIDDFVQETLLRAFSKRSQLRDEAKFEAWIAAIARNLAREWNRAYHRRKRAEASGKTTEAVDSRNPLDALEKAEERELLKRAMARLNDSDRELLRARYLDDASYAELQERYGLSYSAVGQRLHRAKRRLRKIYMSIAAALALFFGSFKHTAWGGMVLMKKTVVIAVAIGVLGGALVGGFLWMRSEGGASLESVDKAGSTDSTLTAQTTDDQETLNRADRSASPDSKPEHSGGSAENKTPLDGINETKSFGLHNTGARERFISIPIDLEGDIVEYLEAFRSVRAALSRVKAGKMDISELSSMIEKFEFNGDWMAHLRIYAKRELGMPLSDLETRYYPAASKRLRKELNAHWEENNLGGEWSRRLKPILHTINWVQKEAPVEHKLLTERYYEQSWELADKVDTFEGYLNVDERTEKLYEFFYIALQELPRDARLFTEYFGIGAEVSPQAPVEIPPPVPSGAPRVDSPAVSDPNLPGASSHSSSESTPREPSQVEPVPPPPPDDPARFEAAVTQSIERYGVQEGMRRLAESHPVWAERIVLWAQERQKRLAAASNRARGGSRSR